MKRTLILGGNGRIGQLAAAHLRKHDPQAEVIQLARTVPADAPPGHFLRFDPFHDDWAMLPPCDLLINAVGAIKESADMPFERVHQGLSSLMIQHRAKLGNPRILQISALGADPTQELPFLKTKGLADELLLAESDTYLLRPSIVCTPGTMLSQRLKQLLKISRIGFGKLLVPKGFPETLVQPIMPEDLGALIVAMASLPKGEGSRIVEAVGPKPWAFGAILQAMAAAQGKPLRLVPVPREIMESFVKYFVGVWFPGTLNLQQFQLLFQDNTADPGPAITLLDRPLRDPLPFWQSEANAS